LGVARAQVRKDLPLSTYTEAYWKIDLHNLFHFVRLRRDLHAQLEIRTVAKAMGELIKPIVPLALRGLLPRRLAAWRFSSMSEGRK
jgi:thymidylate synthase (FAD)